METQNQKRGLKFTKHLNVVGGFCMLLLPMVVLADSCIYDEQLAFTLPVAAITSLDVSAGAGSLYVSSDANTQEISIRARVCGNRKTGLEGMGVEHLVQGNTQYLWTKIPERKGISWAHNVAYIDLEIVIPEGMDMVVKDGSGSLEIRGAGNLVLNDGSGDARLVDVLGNVQVKDGSGDLSIEYVQGSVDVDDGSGQLDIFNVLGTVSIRDGSGDINLRDLQLEPRIVESGSGKVRIDGRNGNTEVSDAH